MIAARPKKFARSFPFFTNPVSVPSHDVSVFLVESTGVCQYHDCNANLKADVGKHIKITDQEMSRLVNRITEIQSYFVN